MSSCETSLSTSSSVDSSASIPSQFASAISDMLHLIISFQSSSANYNNKLSSFFSLTALPSISLNDYIKRIITITGVKESTVISSLIYIDRMCCKGKIKLSEYNIHTLTFISMYLSIKMNEDELYGDEFYANVAGMSTQEMSKLSFVFKTVVDNDLCMSEKEYKYYEDYILRIFFTNYYCGN